MNRPTPNSDEVPLYRPAEDAGHRAEREHAGGGESRDTQPGGAVAGYVVRRERPPGERGNGPHDRDPTLQLVQRQQCRLITCILSASW
jgi:hypothetical protein